MIFWYLVSALNLSASSASSSSSSLRPLWKSISAKGTILVFLTSFHPIQQTAKMGSAWFCQLIWKFDEWKILTDVGCNEGRGIPVALQEDSETVELKGSSTTIAKFHVDLCTYKNDESEEDKTIPRKPRLERSAVWEIVSTETLFFQTIVEPKIWKQNRPIPVWAYFLNIISKDLPPGDDTCNGRQVVQPVECLLSRFTASVHVWKKTKKTCDYNTPDRKTPFSASSKETRHLALERESI